ncbi:MAG: cell surface protein SprA [Prevotellaceae bacterium]|nr:cell surface protein SprA [Prevotellaceae bacterium]
MSFIHRFSLSFSLTATIAIAAVESRAAPSDEDRRWEPAVKESDAYDVTYDERSNLYTFYGKGQERRGTPVKVMNSAEYRRYQFDNAVREAWSTRRNSEMSSTSMGKDGTSKLIPDIRIKSALVSNLLGSDLIKFNIQGAVEAVFGYNWTRTDNPTIPEQYRSHGAFDFKVNMQINASGSIGDRININFINSTDLILNFQDLIKINYQGDEDDIIQKIEAGNVSLPLSGSLITGSQSLFGVKTELKFGHLTIESIISEQKGQSSTINVKGGAQTTLFDIAADKYDANRHFFLSHYFRSRYNDALRYLPIIQSGVNITRLEVWVTNRNNRFESSRNIIALDALGSGSGAPSNDNNILYQDLKNRDAARSMSTVNDVLKGMGLEQVKDFEKVENARRLTPENDYRLNAQLGYISLNYPLNADEVLGVAFEYTMGGRTYRVGEFYDDGVAAPKALFVKMVKGSNLSPRFNTWALMMKNVYSLETYQLSSDNFILNVMYHDDAVGTNVPYITEGNIKNLPLLQALNLDNLNSAGNRYPDGRFDYVEGVTVTSNGGRIIFPMLEPFGRDLGAKIGYPIASKYAYNELYDSTLVKARQFADKNKFRLTGSYKATSASEIILNATDIPEGSVVVTAGGIKLVENVDYTVNYTLGRVQIINPAYLGSNVPLQVSMESMEMFSFVKKTLMGANLKYQFSKDFRLGTTILHLSERPLTQKVTYGDEPIANTIWGLNGSYSREVNLLTKMVDAIPLIETKAPSRVTVDGEFAQLLPGHSSAIGKSGTTYIDDFEASKMTIDLKQYTTWALGSTPEEASAIGGRHFPGGRATTTADSYPLSSGYYRSKLAWYAIDPLFLRNTSSTPSYMRSNQKLYCKNHYVREIDEKEIFPKKDLVIGVDAKISVLNVAYYPNERGPYNYIDFGSSGAFPGKGLTPDGSLQTPRTNFGAMMRSLPITDFETSNIEYLEFWMLDPFIYTRRSGDRSKYSNGRLYFNLGDVSEDVLKDTRKSFENGLPYPYDTTLIEETDWGYVPRVQSLVNTFDNNEAARAIQDVGYDGMNREQARTFFERKYSYLSHLQGVLSESAWAAFEDDPSNDLYHYYRGSDYDAQRLDIPTRYKKYNNPEGNSPVASGGLSTSATTMPNTEDINQDNTLNELESYFEYYIDLTPDAISPDRVGQNYIADVRTVEMNDADYDEHQTVHWYQFKIPVVDGKPFNNIEDFKSIRFIRMFLSGFDTTVICRFARLDLVRGEWRKYSYSLLEAQEGLAQPETGTGSIDIAAVSIEENSDRSPVNYLLPPDISRIVDNTTNQQVQRNEQSMMLTISNLADGDARAAYKSATLDMRQFRRLIMDVHAEAISESRLRDNDLSLFVRVGSDYRYNYYEYEIPLKLTPHGRYADSQREIVWPAENKLDIPLSVFTDLKLERNARLRTTSGMTLTSVYEKEHGKNTVRVVGNPNLGEVHVLMIGVKNPVNKGLMSEDDGLPKDGIVWVNELRFTNFNEEGGWAANMRVAANLADFASVSLAGSMSKAGFGSLDSRILTRSQEDTYQYDLSTNFELGKFFPAKWGVTLPLGFGYAENYIVPLYNPFDPDIKLQDALDRADSEEREQLRNTAIDYAMRKNFSLNNARVAGSGQKLLGPADISNFTVGYAFSEELMRNVNTERDYRREQRVMAAYAYSVKPYVFEPFAKSASLRGSSWKIIRDFNVALYPSQYGFTTDLTDTYTEYIARSFYEGVKITPIIFREQVNNRSYTLGWDITRALKFSFSASNLSRREISTGSEADTAAIDNSWRNTRYDHEFSLGYTLPISKLPVFSWITVTSSYKATYAWDAPQVFSSSSSSSSMPYVGNTIRNSNNFTINGVFNLVTLYNKSGLLKSINQEMDGRSAKKKEVKDVTFEQSSVNLIGGSRRTVKHNLKDATGIKVQVFDEAGKEVKVEMEAIDSRSISIRSAANLRNARVVVTGKAPATENPLAYAGKLTARTLMMLRSLNVTYMRGGETMLPGYTPKTTLMGLDQSHRFSAPGWDFVAGSQSEDFWGNFYGTSTEYMLTRAYRNSWIIGDTTFINPFTMSAATNLSMQATLEPFRDLRVELTAAQTHSLNRTWYDINNNGSSTPIEAGSFSISTISILTAFENPSSETYYKSNAYTRFDNSRRTVADELARQRYATAAFTRLDSTGGFPDGFSGLSQDVLIPAFEVGYLSKAVSDKTIRYADFLSKIPLPNWRITYAGLSRIAALKPLIKSATLSHSYRSTYSINAFATNTNYVEKPGERDAQGDFYSPYSIAAVSLNEQITLGSVDVTWQNGIQTRVELRKNRRVDLSMTNNQIIENNAWEGAAGAGYTFAKVPQLLRFSDGQSATTSVTLRADFTYRNDKNLIRKLAEDTHQITDGRRNMAVKLTSDYAIMKDLTFRIFFDWTENNPYVSAVNTENISFGFSLRYVLGM